VIAKGGSLGRRVLANLRISQNRGDSEHPLSGEPGICENRPRSGEMIQNLDVTCSKNQQLTFDHIALGTSLQGFCREDFPAARRGRNQPTRETCSVATY
jgi:hypothetical protein